VLHHQIADGQTTTNGVPDERVGTSPKAGKRGES
jgi:hypothetical protein